TFDAQRQYPAWLEKRHRMQGKDISSVAPATAWFEIEKSDKGVIEAKLGRGILKSPIVKLSRNYKGELLIDFEADEAAFVRHIIGLADLGAEASQEVTSAASLEGLQSAIGNLKAHSGDGCEPFHAAATALDRAKRETLKDAADL